MVRRAASQGGEIACTVAASDRALVAAEGVAPMLSVKVENSHQLRFVDPQSGTGVSVSFQRTLRVPDDGRRYPPPPGLGAFPVRRIMDFKHRVPASWARTSGVLIPMYQREALWLSFQARPWRPNAVKVASGKVNAVSGRPWTQKLEGTRRTVGPRGEPEPEPDYLTVPPQPWLHGFNTGRGAVRQFVAMPLGTGYTVEGHISGREEHGGLQVLVFEPRAGRFPDRPPQAKDRARGLAGGGAPEPKFYPDPHGIDTWDDENYGRVFVHLVNSAMWREITGEEPPPTPVTAKSYSDAGYPWSRLYDEEKADVAASAPVRGA